MKNYKTFYEAQTAGCLKKNVQPQPEKSFLRLWNKYFLTEIYKNIQTFAFKVLRKCSSWESRNGAVQMVFLTPARNILAGKFVN